jgi:hypothetical protein
MACTAVAVASALVAEEHLRQYLTPAQIAAPVTAYLQARFPDARINYEVWGEEITWTITDRGHTRRLTVRGVRVITTDYDRNQAAAQELTTEIQQALTAIGGAYWQNATYQYLAANYQVTESQQTADGSLVVRVRV